MRLSTYPTMMFTVMAFVWSGGVAGAELPRQVFHPSKEAASSKPTKKLRLKWMKFWKQKRVLHVQLRSTLTSFCRVKKKRPTPMADRKGNLSMTDREHRIVGLDLRMKRLKKYAALLKRAYKSNRYEQKVMRIGYLVSDALFTLGSYGLAKTLKVPWLQVVMPVTMKLTNQLVSSNSKLPQPSPFQLYLEQDFARMLQVMQFKLNPGPFQHNACYLRSAKLRDEAGKPCHPDHPFIRSRHKQLGQLWLRSRKLLKRNDLPAFWSGVFEFLTHNRQKNLQNQEFFILATSSLLKMQLQYLQKMRSVLYNDYQAWGCQQLSDHKANKKKARRIAL